MLEWIKQNKATAALLLVVIAVLLYGGYQAMVQTMETDSESDVSEEKSLDTEIPGSESRTHKDKAATPVVVAPQYVDLTAPGYGREAKNKKLEKGVKRITLGDLTIKTIGG